MAENEKDDERKGSEEEAIMRAFLQRSMGPMSDPWSPVMPVRDFPPREGDLKTHKGPSLPRLPDVIGGGMGPLMGQGMPQAIEGSPIAPRDQNAPVEWGLGQTIEGYSGRSSLMGDPLTDLIVREMLEERENNMMAQHLFERGT